MYFHMYLSVDGAGFANGYWSHLTIYQCRNGDKLLIDQVRKSIVTSVSWHFGDGEKKKGKKKEKRKKDKDQLILSDRQAMYIIVLFNR